MINALVVDDHALVRRGVKQILTETPDLGVGGEAANGAEALRKVRENEYDVVLLDISLPGENGVGVLKELKATSPQIPLLVLSRHSGEQYAVRSLRAGASGYLTRGCGPEELIAALRRVAQGRVYVDSSLAERLAEHIAAAVSFITHERLSDREYEVFLMIASGKATREIAAALSLRPKTIGTYRARAFAKMGMKTNAELVRWAFEQGLLD